MNDDDDDDKSKIPLNALIHVKRVRLGTSHDKGQGGQARGGHVRVLYAYKQLSRIYPLLVIAHLW
jgi:hypothetical protein